MTIGILGAGNVGGALAKRWSMKDHEVLLGVRNPEVKREWSGVPNISVHPVDVAISKAEVILMALPVGAIVETLKSITDESRGKVLIDATNSVFAKPDPYQNGYTAAKAITHADVIKGFNTTGFENMEDPIYDGVAIDMFMAGGSPNSKEIMRQLSLDAGFAECYDFGGDDKIDLIEQFAMSWINLAILQKEGRGMAFKVLKR
jgi:hypothetical protein